MCVPAGSGCGVLVVVAEVLEFTVGSRYTRKYGGSKRAGWGSIIGGIAGWLAGLVMRGSGYGVIGDVIVGLLGAFVGNYLVDFFHVNVRLGNPWLDRGVVAFGGAVVLLLIIGLLRPRSLGERVKGLWRR